MRLSLSVVALVLVACRSDPECQAMPAGACDGADLVVEFDESPGTRGMVCQWWSEGRSVRFRTDGLAWCVVD